MIDCGDFCFERMNPVRNRNFSELAQQNCADSASLETIGNGEGDFRAMLVKRCVEGMAHDTLFRSAQSYQTDSSIEVRFAACFRGERVTFGHRKKSQPPRFF